MRRMHTPHLALRAALGLIVCLFLGAIVAGARTAPPAWAGESPLPTPTSTAASAAPTVTAPTPGSSAWASAGSALLWVGLGAAAGLVIAYATIAWHRNRTP
jgi:ABC-type nitrate/sulfonate/bicarbonate transport system permease component